MSAIDKIVHNVKLVADSWLQQGKREPMTQHDYLSFETQCALRDLAHACGATYRAIDHATEGELVTIYRVASQRPASGQEVATKLNRKYDPHANALPPAPPSASSGELERLRSDVSAMLDDMRRQSSSHTTLCDIVDALSSTVENQTTLQDETVRRLVADALKAQQPTSLTVTTPTAQVVPMGLVHEKTASVIQVLAAGVNVYLHGPAGSGKTTMAQQAAKALGVPFHFAAKVESEYLLLGFRDARGDAVRTPFREAYEHGGLFLFDELDRSSPGAVTALNAALANGVCPFPDKLVERHADFYCIAAGNTVMTGASRQYTAGVQQDASSVDRFFFIEFGYDEKLERALASNEAWCEHVQALRAIVAERGLAHLITPRATLDGCKLLAAGLPWADVERGAIFKGLDAATVEQLKSALGSNLISATTRRNRSAANA